MRLREPLSVGALAACVSITLIAFGLMVAITYNSCDNVKSSGLVILYGGPQNSSFRWSLVCMTRSSLPHGGENEKSANAPVQPLARLPKVEP